MEEELEAMDTSEHSEPVVETPKGRGAKKAAEKEEEETPEAEAESEENNDDNSKNTPRSRVCRSLTLGYLLFLNFFFFTN